MNLQPLLTIIAIFIISMIPSIVLVYFFRLSRKEKRTPLTRNLLRSPGQSLRTQIDDLNDTINSYLLTIFIFPVIIYAINITQVTAESAKLRQNQVIFIVGCVVMLLYLYFKLFNLLKQRASFNLGLDGEMSVGQELNNLMFHGYRVYHDFPADKFNIDHVVVGSKGVFAVETKARMKRRVKGGGAAVKVRYDGNALHFPGWSERQPVNQAKSQAIWLAQWLNSAVGESVMVRPVLAIPGWYLIKESPDNLLLFNGKNPETLLNAVAGSLSPQLITRIAHQLEQRCRDVEPSANPGSMGSPI